MLLTSWKYILRKICLNELKIPKVFWHKANGMRKIIEAVLVGVLSVGCVEGLIRGKFGVVA